MRLIQAVHNWRIKRAFKVLDKYKVKYFIVPDDHVIKIVSDLVKQVQQKFGKETGEFRRHQALRASLNALPGVSERKIALAIEIACTQDQ